MLSRSVSPAGRDLPRVHFSSLLVVLAIQVVGILTNCGGNELEDGYGLKFGCPMEFGSTASEEDVSLELAMEKRYGERSWSWSWSWWWQIDQLKVLQLTPLLTNAALWLFLSLATGALFEFRRRRRISLFAMTRLDAVTTAVALVVLAVGAQSLYSDNLTAFRLRSITGLQTIDRPLPHANMQLSVTVPSGWFWDTVTIPEKWRPATRHRVSLRGWEGSPLRLEGDALRTLPQFQQLKELELSLARFSQQAFTELAVCPLLSRLQLYGCDLTVEHVRSLNQLSALDSLYICEEDLDPELLIAIGRLTQIRSLDISCNSGSDELVRGLAELERLCFVSLNCNQLTEQGVPSLLRIADRCDILQISKPGQLSEQSLQLLEAHPRIWMPEQE